MTKKGKEREKANILIPEIPIRGENSNSNTIFTNINNISNSELKDFSTNIYNFLENAPTNIKKSFSSLISYINFLESNLSISSPSSSTFSNISNTSISSSLSTIKEDISFIKNNLKEIKKDKKEENSQTLKKSDIKSFSSLFNNNTTNYNTNFNSIIAKETNKLKESLYIPPLELKTLLKGKNEGEKWDLVRKELEKYLPKTIITNIRGSRYPPSNNIILTFNTSKEKEEFENLSKL